VLTNVVLQDELPDHLAFLSVSEGGTIQDGVVSWSYLELQPGEEIMEAVLVRIESTMPPNSAVQNTAVVTTAESVSDTSTVTSDLNPWILPITKSAAAGVYAYGDTVRFQITLDNAVAEDVNGVIVTDSLPDPLTFLSASHGGQFNGETVTWELGTLAGNTLTELSHRNLGAGYPRRQYAH
jgi:uncharacterized repeat protein (TIGR01451 family)